MRMHGRRLMANPMLREGMFQGDIVDGEPMTMNGTIGKTALLLGLAFLSSMYTYGIAMAGAIDKLSMFMWGGIIVGFIACIVCAFNRHLAKPLSIVYALAEGLALGGLSAMYNSLYNGIIIQAVVATMITLFIMLGLYVTRIIKATPTFYKVVITATISITIFYLLVILGSFFNIGFLAPFQSAYGNVFVIGAVIVIAALNLIFDFNSIEMGVEFNAPSNYEWYCAMGLMVTLVWLYIEFLRLFARLNRR